jgi:hypothetical protein
MGHARTSQTLLVQSRKPPDKSAISLARTGTGNSGEFRHEAKPWYFNTYAEPVG